MTDYALTGKKGTGKSKNAVRLIRDRYLRRGRMVASNLDIYLSPMFGPYSKITYIRLPDRPSAQDLAAIVGGNPKAPDEDWNGGLFLDEMATWLNTRSFADKDRAATLDWFAHGRKHGWDTYYIMQNVMQVDKQMRESFIEQTVRHTRFDKVRIPFIGSLLGLLFGDKAGYLPRFHLAVSRMGVNPQEMVADRASFVGKDIEKCYDTLQIFSPTYPHGTHTVLSPWHVEGRFLEPEKKPFLVRLVAAIRGKPIERKRPALRPKSPQVALAARLAPDDAWRIARRLAQVS